MAAPKNPQNDILYVPAAVRKKDVAAKRLHRTRSTFSQSLMVSVGASKLGRNGWYSSSLESRWMEPNRDVRCCCNICFRTDIPHTTGEFFIVQQDWTVLRRTKLVRWSVFLKARLLLSSRRVCGRRTALTSIHTVDYKIWGSDATMSLTDEMAERGRFEAASDWRVERNGAIKALLCAPNRRGH